MPGYRPLREIDVDDGPRSDGSTSRLHCLGTTSSNQTGRPHLIFQLYIAVAATLIIVLQLSGTSKLCPTTFDRQGTESEGLDSQYSRNYDYMSLDHKFDHLWQYSNFSTLSVPEPELDTNENVDAAISMFHQLHCLSSFRTALQDAYEGQPVAFDWRSNGHWPHCLDYLRNTFLCFADGTLELPRIVDGKRTDFIDGAQDRRTCRPAKALFEQQTALGNHNVARGQIP